MPLPGSLVQSDQQRIPALPALDDQTPLPRWRATWVGGRIAAEAADGDAHGTGDHA